MRPLLAKSVCLVVAASVSLAPPVSAHDGGGFFFDENDEWTQDGCHEDLFSGRRHCHEAPGGLEDPDTYLLVAGVVVVGTLIWRAAQRNRRQNARQASSEGKELPRATLEDLLRRDRIRFDLLPVKNSLGKFDGARFRLSFRF